MNAFSLSTIKIGRKVKIENIDGDKNTQLKLLSLGILPGDIIEVTGRGLCGGPISMKHDNGTFFALRRGHAAQIKVIHL